MLKSLNNNPAKVENIKSKLSQSFEQSHFFLAWENYSLWWKIYQLNETQQKLPRNFPFGDPWTMDRDTVKFVNESEASSWPYKPESVQIPQKYFNRTGECHELQDVYVKIGFSINNRLGRAAFCKTILACAEISNCAL